MYLPTGRVSSVVALVDNLWPAMIHLSLLLEAILFL